MSVFRFSLGRILDLRRQVEQEKARTLAQARRRSEEAREAWENLAEIQQAGRAAMAEAHRTGGSVGRLRHMEFVLEQMAGKLENAEVRREEAEEDLSASVEKYTEALRDRKSLDRLRSRRWEEWKTEENRREQKDMDELAVTRFGRLASESPGS